jgi:hypothetical protein
VHVVAAGDSLLGSETTRLLIERYLSELPAGCAVGVALGRTHLPRTGSAPRGGAGPLQRGNRTPAVHRTGDGQDTHVTHILTKLGLRDRLQAVVFAYETGLIRRAASDRR